MNDYCCEGFEKTVQLNGIRKLHGKWISDILTYNDMKNVFSDVYKIDSVQMLLIKFCPLCGSKQS